MSFSIKATIRDWLVPEHRVRCRFKLWRSIILELQARGSRKHEAGAFLLGREHGRQREVLDAIYYDQLDPSAYDTGVCVLRGDAFSKLWGLCRQRQLMVVADVHTHPGAAGQSGSDRTNPMIATAGHVAIIVPQFAKWPIAPGALGIYEYLGRHEWANRCEPETTNYLYTGIWS